MKYKTKYLSQLWDMYILQWLGIRRNLAAMIIIAGLAVLPSLYAWFNIAANEDPYGNTGNIKVAVCNLDKGTKIDVVNMNAGLKIIDKLKANHKIGWQFIDVKDDALEGVRSGKYYAAVIIPENFSEDIVSVIKGTIRKPKIFYYVNEKINAITPKVTDKGISTLENEIDKSFVKEVSEVTIYSLQAIDKRYQQYKPSLVRLSEDLSDLDVNMNLFLQSLSNLNGFVDSLNNVIVDSRKTLPQLTKTLNQASELTLKSQDALLESKKSMSRIRDTINMEMNTLPILFTSIEREVDDAFRADPDKINLIGSQLKASQDHVIYLKEHVSKIRRTVDAINNWLPVPLAPLSHFSQKLSIVETQAQGLIDALNWAQETVKKGNRSVDEVRNNVRDLIHTLNSTMDHVKADFNGPVQDALDGVSNQAIEAFNSAYQLLQQSSGLIPNINQLLLDAQGAATVSNHSLDASRLAIEQSKKILDRMGKGIKNINQDKKLQEAIDFIKQDAEKESDFFSNPIEVETKRFFPVPNYGAAMSPFYTILAIWVGSLLMMSMISPINKKGLARYPDAPTIYMYVSRLLFYQTIAFMQALIITLGNLFLLRVYCMHPVGMVFYNLFVALVFSTFIFSMLFVFRNVGKAICIVILVLQIAASGGTFPTEMMPAFFQWIHPFLPFTYAIGGIRELVAGLYSHVLLDNIKVLLFIMVGSIIMVFLVGPKVIRQMEKFDKEMKKSGLE